MTIRESVEGNVVVWLLGTLITGFTAGLGVYEGVLRIAQLEVVSRGTVEGLRADASKLREAGTGALPTQDWLRLRAIEFDSAADVERYRVVMRGDGVPYSYPGHAVWKANDPKVPEQDFPLRTDVVEHQFEFDLFLLDQNGSELHAVGQQATTPRAGQHEGSYQVFLLGGATRSGQPLATLRYEVRRRE
jgi:hypothetical protein